MAIAQDAHVSNAGLSSAGATTFSFSHICTGSNLILWVGAFDEDGGDSVTGVTYGGVAMTKAGSSLNVNSSGNYISLWYLESPATGSNTVQITRAGTIGKMGGISASYTAASQTGQPDPTGSNSATITGNGTITMSRTTTANNDWAIVFAYDNDGNNLSAGTNSTAVTSASYLMFFDNSGHGAITPAGSFSMNVIKSSGSGGVGGIMASFSPVGGASPVVHSLATLGVRRLNV